MVFHWSLSDCKSAQVSRTFLSILTYLDNAVVWMVSSCSLISKSSSPFTKLLEIVPSAPITNGITVNFMVYRSFISLASSKYLPLSSFSFNFHSVVCAGRQSPLFGRFSFVIFFLAITRSDRLAGIMWSICISKSQNILCVLFSSRIDSGLYIYHFFSMVKFQSFPQFLVDHLSYPVESNFILFCTTLLHQFIMWLSVLSLSPHNLFLLFCCVLSIFALTLLVLTALFCSAIRKDSVFLLRLPFPNYVQVFLCEISSVCRLKYPYNCFSSHFCFMLHVLFLVTVISLSLVIFYIVCKSSCRCIDVIIISITIIIIYLIYLLQVFYLRFELNRDLS